MNGKRKTKNEKRVIKGYKIKESVYRKALKRAQKSRGALASLIEIWVCCYAEGYPVGLIPNNETPEEIE